MFRTSLHLTTVLTITSIALPSTARADDDIGVDFTGDWPADCDLRQTYMNGSSGDEFGCVITGDGSCGTIDGDEAWCSDGITIDNIGDSSTRVWVAMTGDEDSCILAGGLTIDALWGDGAGSSNFDVHEWETDDSDNVDEILERFGEGGDLDGTHRIRMVQPDFAPDTEDYHYLDLFVSDVRKSSKSGSQNMPMTDSGYDLESDVPTFCDFHDGPVALRSDSGDHVSVGGSSGDHVSVGGSSGDHVSVASEITGNELFEISCDSSGRVRFTGPWGRFIKTDGSGLNYATANPSANYARFDAYLDDGDQWYFDARAGSGSDTWWSASSSGMDLTTTPGSHGDFTVEEHDPMQGFEVNTTTATSTYSDTDSPIYASLILSDTSTTETVELDAPDANDHEKGESGTYELWVDEDRLDDGVTVVGLRLENFGSDGWRPSDVELVDMSDDSIVVSDGFDESFLLDDDCDIDVDDGCSPVITVGTSGDVQRLFKLTATTSDSAYAESDGSITARLQLSDGSYASWVQLNLPGDDFEYGDEDTYTFLADESSFSTDGLSVIGLHLREASGDGWIPGSIALTAEASTSIVLVANLLVGDGSGEGTFVLDDDCSGDDVADGCAADVLIDTSGALSAP